MLTQDNVLSKSNMNSSKRFPRDYFLPGTLMLYKVASENIEYMFIVTGTMNNGRINVVLMGTTPDYKTAWITNNVSWNRDFDTNTWEIIPA